MIISPFILIAFSSYIQVSAQSSYMDLKASVADGDEIVSPLMELLGRVKPPHSTVEQTSLASFLSAEEDRVHDSELVAEREEVESAFVDLVIHSTSVVNNATHERQWAFNGPLGYQPDRLLAIHRWKIWWAIPKLLKGSRGELGSPAQTYLLLGQLADVKGAYLAVLPLVDHNMGFSLEAVEGRGLVINGHDNSPKGELELQRQLQLDSARGRLTKRRALLVTRGADPLLLVRRSFKILKEYMRRQLGVVRSEASGGGGYADFQEQLRNELDALQQAQGMAMRRDLWSRGPGPAFADVLGWCTWDSFYTDLSTGVVLRGLASFNATGVTPRFVILDDGWQATDVSAAANSKQWGGRLMSLQANFKFAPGYGNGPQGSSEAREAAAAAGNVENSAAPGANVGSLHSLGVLIESAREQHHVRHFLVWHTLTGYWAGVDPASPELGKEYGASIVFPSISDAVHRTSHKDALRTEPFTLTGVGLVRPDLAEHFFDAYHAQLAAMGVDGVKVDAQSVLALLQGSDDEAEAETRGDIGIEVTPGGEIGIRSEKQGQQDGGNGGLRLAAKFHKALRNSVDLHFGKGDRPVIHCMCHSQETLMSVLGLYPDEEDDPAAAKLRPVVRGSDDYWPGDPASHGPHLYSNALSSLVFSSIGLHDWDMFQTTGDGRRSSLFSSSSSSSSMHAASRAISGGPVYVSDTPDKHDGVLLRKLAFRDGSIPRCIRNARPTVSGLFIDPQREAGKPLLLQNANSASGLVVGVFSIAGAVLENDKDQFRFLTPDEMLWPHDGADEQVRVWAAKPAPKVPTPVFDDPLWAVHLGIEWTVSPLDVEEGRVASGYDLNEELAYGERESVGSDAPHWVAHRLSDGELFGLLSTPAHRVPVSLPKVFDFEIVSFAKVQWATAAWASDDSGSAGSLGRWGAFLGAVGMLNPGGAVLASTVHEWSGNYEPNDAAEVDVQLALAREQISNFEAQLEYKLKPRTCIPLEAMVTDYERYIDMWLHAGKPLGPLEMRGEEREAAEAELDRILDNEITELQEEMRKLREKMAAAGTGSGVTPQSDQLREGLVLEADLLGEGKYWFIAFTPDLQCRASVLMAKSLTWPDPDIAVTARAVEMTSLGSSPSPYKEVCLVELTVGSVALENEAQGDEVRGVHVSIIVT